MFDKKMSLFGKSGGGHPSLAHAATGARLPLSAASKEWLIPSSISFFSGWCFKNPRKAA